MIQKILLEREKKNTFSCTSISLLPQPSLSPLLLPQPSLSLLFSFRNLLSLSPLLLPQPSLSPLLLPQLVSLYVLFTIKIHVSLFLTRRISVYNLRHRKLQKISFAHIMLLKYVRKRKGEREREKEIRRGREKEKKR